MGDFGFLVFDPVNKEKIVVNARSTNCAMCANPGTNRFTIDETTFTPPGNIKERIFYQNILLKINGYVAEWLGQIELKELKVPSSIPLW